MSSYAQLALNPFCSLDASHAAIVRSHGRRQCWPRPGYDISSAIVKMLSSADSAAVRFLRQSLNDGLLDGTGSAYLRGAGLCGPLGSRCWLRRPSTIFARATPLLQHLANAIVPQLAVLLLRQDLGLDRPAARKLLYEGGLYGRLVFPLLPSLPQPQQQHSPQPQPASPSPLEEIPEPPNPPEPEPSNLALPPQKVVSAPPSSEVLSHEEFFEIQTENADITPQLEQVTSSIPLSMYTELRAELAFRNSVRSPKCAPHGVGYGAARLTQVVSQLRAELLRNSEKKWGGARSNFGRFSQKISEYGVSTELRRSPAEFERSEISITNFGARSTSQNGTERRGVHFRTRTPEIYSVTQFAPPSYWQGFGRHAVAKIIGGGSQGSILECIDRLTWLSLVIKMSRCTSTGHPPIPMLREIHALRKAEHPNLLYLQAVLYDGIQIGLVLPRASQDLKTVIDDHYRQGLQVGAIKLYMKQLLSGLAYLHDKTKLLHLDLKPENLLLNYYHQLRIKDAPNPTPGPSLLRIADCGLARDIGPAGRQRTVVTMAYRAPEVYFRVDRFGDAVDIFSAGVILREMLDGIPWAKSAYAPFHCFEHMLDALGCGPGELWPGTDQLPGVWHGEDGAGDDPAFLAKAGRRHFTPRPRELPSSAARYRVNEVKDHIHLRHSMLELDSSLRPHARDARTHAAFINPPLPALYGTLSPLKDKYRPPLLK
ncbi:hypothetical protein V8E36_009069 [Tilletia maclaganii]